MESSEDAIIGKTLDGVITSWNMAAERIYGYSTNEAIGKSISILVPTGQVDEILKILELIKTGEKIENYETVRQRKDGKFVDVSLAMSAIKDAAGKIIGVSTIARDISDRKEAEKALQEKSVKLEATLKELRERTERLQRFHNLTVDRELQMVELKKEIDSLLERLGEPKRY